MFTKQGEFTKKVTDLTDVPSQNLAPSEIKSYFQTPPDELKGTLNRLVDDLTANTGAIGVGAKETDNTDSTVQALLNKRGNDLTTHKTASELDHPDESVTTRKIKTGAVTREKIASGAIGTNELDPAILAEPTTEIGQQAKFAQIDASLAEKAKQTDLVFVNVKNPPAPLNGAKGDGVTDDTTAIQAIMNVYPYVYFPDGTYIIKDTTSNKGLVPLSNSRYLGSGNAIIKLGASQCNGFSNYIRDFNLTGYGSLNNVVFENLIFDGDYNNVADPANDNYGYGIYIVRSKNVTVKNCKFYRNWYSGLVLWGVDTQLIQDNYFDDIGNKATVVGGANGGSSFCSDGGTTAPSRNVTIYRNTINNCYWVFHASGGVNNGQVLESDTWSIRENKIYNCIYGIQFYNGWYTHVDVCNNYFYGIQLKAVNITGLGQGFGFSTPLSNIRVDNNHFYIKTATAVANTALIYAYSTDLLSICNNQILATVNLPITYDIIVTNPEYNGSAYVPPKVIIEGNNIKVQTLRYIFNMNNQFVKLFGNVVFAGTVTNNAVWTTSSVDLRMSKNEFSVTTGGIWNRAYQTRVVKDNKGLKTRNYGLTTVSAASTTFAHGITAGSPPIIIGSLRDTTRPNYTVGFTADNTNITISVFDGAGNPSAVSTSVSWEAIHWDEFQDL